MKRLYVIAHTWRDVDIKWISEHTDDGFEIKADPNDDPQEFLDKYYDWSREENDNMCDNVMVLEIIELDN